MMIFSSAHSMNSPKSARQRASDWLWRPWYAKLWWAAIPLWWTGMAAAGSIEPLGQFYRGALTGFLNVLFFPVTTLLVLGFGFLRTWIDNLGSAYENASWVPNADENAGGRGFGQPHPSVDIFDPRSGTIYVGNPENQTHD